jgi:ureidoacrylate peracid hydrolase
MTDDAPYAGLPDALVRLATRRHDAMAARAPIDPKRTALLALNMQNAWLAADGPFDSGRRAASVLPVVNRLAGQLREKGGHVFWLRQTTGRPGTPQYWSGYFDHFVRPDLRAIAVDALIEGSPLHALHTDVDRAPADTVLPKYRFNAFLENPHDLDALLRQRGIDTVIVAGTATNVCCESTVRDAMMRGFRCFMPHDAVVAPDDEAHFGALRSVMQVFADVRASSAIL